MNGQEPPSEVRVTPLGTVVTVVLVLGLLGLGVYLIAPGWFGGGTTDVAEKTDVRPRFPTARSMQGEPPRAEPTRAMVEAAPADEEPASPPAREPAAAPASPQKNVLARIKRTGVLRVGMEEEAPPMNYVANGRRQGFDFQIAFELAQRLGAKRVEIVEADYDALPGLLGNGTADAIMGGYVADPSIDGVAWSDGYLKFGLCLIVKQGSAIKEPKHLAGKKVGIYADPAAREWLETNVPSVGKIEEFQYTGWFKELDQGNVDAIVYDYPFAVEEVKPFPRLKIVKLNLNESEYAVGLPAQNDDLLDAVNSSLAAIRESEDFGGWVKQYMKSEAVQAAPLAKGTKVYVVKAGDTLSRIAQAELGKMGDWPKIWELNKSRVGNPHLIEVGFQLAMP
jgi:ABC-type amino acid transport substrate-binding protein